MLRNRLKISVKTKIPADESLYPSTLILKSRSHSLKARDEVKIPSLTERQQMFDILNAYRLSDTSGESLIDEHVMHLITDTFEYVEAVEEICKYYRQPTNIAESIHAIKRHVLSK
jgi:hypothetical protein